MRRLRSLLLKFLLIKPGLFSAVGFSDGGGELDSCFEDHQDYKYGQEREHEGDGLRTEKSRYRRSLARFRNLMQRMFHLPIREQVINLNRVLSGHCAYYGIAGNFRVLQRIYRAEEFCWRKMLRRRSREGAVSWEAFHRIKERFPLQRPNLLLPYPELQRLAVL